MRKILLALVVSFLTFGCQAATIPYGNLDTNTFQYGSSTNPGVVYFAYWTNVFNVTTLDTSPNTRVPFVSLGVQRPYYYMGATNVQAELDLFISGGTTGLLPGRLTWNASFPGSNTVFVSDPTNGLILKTSTTNRFQVRPNGVWEFGSSNSVNSASSRSSRFTFYGQGDQTRVARFSNGTNAIAAIAFGPTNVDGIGIVGAWGHATLGGMLSTWGINGVTTNNWGSGTAGTNFYVGAVSLSATPASMLGSDTTGATIPIALANGVVPVFSGSNLVASALTGNGSGTTNTGNFTNTGTFGSGTAIQATATNVGIGASPLVASQANALRVMGNTRIATGQLILDGGRTNSAYQAVGEPVIFYADSTGGTYPFAENGNLVIQGRGDADRDIVFVTGETNAFIITRAGAVTNNGTMIQMGAQTNASTLGVAGNVIFSTNLTMVQDLAFKATTTLWTIISDEETKDNIVATTKGSAEFLAVPIKEFDYNGKFGTETGKHSIGIVAQDLAASAFASSVKPLVFQDTEKSTNMVEGSPVVIDIPKGDPKTVLSVNLHEYFMAGFQTIKEQQVLITNLLARIAVLEAKP